jgi:four helix bundle protein
MLGHERLAAWEKCHRFALAAYQCSRSWPKEERYGLTSQFRRAALSAPANLAEGAARSGARAMAFHTNIALGSLAETAYYLRFARDLELIAEAEWRRLDELRREAGGLTWRLYRALRARAEEGKTGVRNPPTSPSSPTSPTSPGPPLPPP